MKKILAGLVLGGLLVTLFLPMIALSQGPEEVPTGCTMDYTITGCPDKGDPCPFSHATIDCEVCCLLNSVYTATDWIFYILTLMVVIVIIIGGITFATAAGDPEKAGKGKKIIAYAIIGMIVAVIAKLVPAVTRFILGF